MSEFLLFLVIGLTTGSVYAIAGMGLVLTYTTSGVFNFAHGALAAVSAYLFYELWELQGLPWPIAFVLAVALSGLVGGYLLELLSRALRYQGTAAKVVATVGLLLVLQGLVVLRYGNERIPLREFLPESVIEISGSALRLNQLMVVGLAAIFALGLYIFFRRSRQGVAMQSVVDDPDLLALQGTSPTRVRRYAWTIGSGFAALSGVLIAPTMGLDVMLLTLLVVQAFGAAAVGAFNNLAGTYLGGLGIGVAASLGTGYLTGLPGANELSGVFPFLVLFVVLLVVPRARLVERGGAVTTPELPRARFSRESAMATAIIGGVLLAILPLVAGARLPIVITALVYVALLASLGLLVRTSGQVSLCHMAFAAIGAATYAQVAGAGIPWAVAILLGGLVALPAGALVAIPAIRLPGTYLAVATFGFGILVELLLLRRGFMFGLTGSIPAPRPAFLGDDVAYYFAVLAVVAAICATVVLVTRSRLGRLLVGLADSPVALTAHGLNTRLLRLYVFCLSAFLAGVAGALIGPITGTVGTLNFPFIESLLLLAVLYIAGRQPILSPVIAATLLIVVPNVITFETGPVPELVFGAAAILAGIGAFRSLGSTIAGSSRMRYRTANPMAPRNDVARRYPAVDVSANGSGPRARVERQMEDV